MCLESFRGKKNEKHKHKKLYQVEIDAREDNKETENKNKRLRENARVSQVTRRGITSASVFTYYLHYVDCGELSFSNPFSGISVDVLIVISRLYLLALLRCVPHCTSETSSRDLLIRPLPDPSTSTHFPPRYCTRKRSAE